MRTVTNFVAQARAESGPATAGAFRTWRDHRGTAIEARWTDTAADGKAITLETRGGKKIRAVLRKFSDEDRAFVKSELRR